MERLGISAWFRLFLQSSVLEIMPFTGVYGMLGLGTTHWCRSPFLSGYYNYRVIVGYGTAETDLGLGVLIYLSMDDCYWNNLDSFGRRFRSYVLQQMDLV